MRKAAVLLLLLLICSLAGCVEQREKETKVVDQLGREVYIPANVEKVVSLWPEATSVLLTLDCKDKIVGLDSGSLNHRVLSKLLPNNIVDVGNPMRGTLSLEKLAQLKPDVVFMYTDDSELADKIQKSLGIPVVCVRLNPPPERKLSFDMVTIIGKCVGKEERAKEVKNYIEGELSEITSVTSKIPDSEKPKVYVTFPYDSLKTARKLDVVELAGGKNVAKGSKGVGGSGAGKGAWHTYTVNFENMVLWNPDIIILHGFGNIMPEDIINDPNWQNIKAVKEGKVYRLTLGWGAWDLGSFTVNVITFAKVFYPDKFSFDAEKKTNEVLKELYGVDGLYTKLKNNYKLSDI